MTQGQTKDAAPTDATPPDDTPLLTQRAFAFTPSGPGGVVEGAAFTLVFKALACAIVLSLLGWTLALWWGGSLAAEPGQKVELKGLSWMFASIAILCWMLWPILRGRTRITRATITQDWVWQREAQMPTLVHAKVVRVRGFEWLIAPRLKVRAGLGKYVIFNGAEPQLWAEFERIAVELNKVSFKG